MNHPNLNKFRLLALSVLPTAVLAACGGGKDAAGNADTPSPAPRPVVVPPAPAPVPVVPAPSAFNCYTGTVTNNVGAEDPFYVNSWHLKNTGPLQTVSATGNAAALTGIDANLEKVHRGGQGCTGKLVAIAIVDSGVELTHEEGVQTKTWTAHEKPKSAMGIGQAGTAVGVTRKPRAAARRLRAATLRWRCCSS